MPRLGIGMNPLLLCRFASGWMFNHVLGNTVSDGVCPLENHCGEGLYPLTYSVLLPTCMAWEALCNYKQGRNR